jgi:hypothetical protein
MRSQVKASSSAAAEDGHTMVVAERPPLRLPGESIRIARDSPGQSFDTT